MKSKFIFFAIFFLVSTPASCTSIDPHAPNSIYIYPTDSTPTDPLATSLVTPNANPEIPNETPTFFINLPGCTEIMNEDILINQGTVILADNDYFILQDLKTSERTSMGRSAYSYGVSPDYKKFAYIADNYIVVTSADGTWLNRYPANEKWSGVIDWLNTEKLMIERDEWVSGDLGTLSPIIVFDLVSGEFDTISPKEFPGIVLFMAKDWGPKWPGRLAFLPNSELSYAFYAAENDKSSIILWDRVSQKEVVRINNFGGIDWESWPEWSQNGKFFITSGIYEEGNLPYIEGGKDLLLVQTNGVIKNLTNLANVYKAAERGYSLSPEEDKIAFWLDPDYQGFEKVKPQSWQLAILDLASGSLSTYCTYGGRTPWPTEPIWSPDGTKLLLTSYDYYNEYPRSVSIFDIENISIMEISEDTEGVGWLHSLP